MFSKLISLVAAFIMFIAPCVNLPRVEVDERAFQTQYTNVFVHGLGGWGSYDPVYKVAPYWGVFGGDLMQYLNARGFSCKAASVNPTSSAWDRACELYAQLTGTVVDYGVEHSARCRHARFGEDYSGRALVDSFSAKDKINLLGHSFGGATVLTFVRLMASGSEAEKNATPEGELSALFTGGKADWIHAIVTLAAPLNGTTAYNVQEDIDVDPNATAEEKAVVYLLTNVLHAPKDGRIDEDSAAFDMHIDNALALCDWFQTLPNVYYFSLPCAKVTQNVDGTYSPIVEEMEPLFKAASARMGKYTGQTPNGYVIDESWQQNDGLVNTKSARAPLNAPQKAFDANDLRPGVWNVFPTYDGDHMSLQGGLLHKNDIRSIYVDLLLLLNATS